LRVLGAMEGLDVLEYGCGGAQWAVALASDGARVVGLDQSRGQLRHAARTVRASGPAVASAIALVCASGESVPLADESFDVVFCDHGAMSFCDPQRSVPEVARLLRPGGRFAFSHVTPWPYLTWSAERDRVTRTLRAPYFGMRRFDDGEGAGTIDFQLAYGDWIRLFRSHGFVVDDLIELRPPKGARTGFVDFDRKWARRWPAEQIWNVHKT
jgi:SAM-dependent methyltransferase